MKKDNSIKESCRILVENILDKNFLKANTVLSKLVSDIEDKREQTVLKSLFSEAADDEETENDELEGGNTKLDEEGEESDETEDSTQNPDFGENLGDESADTIEGEDMVGAGKLNEMSTELTNLNHALNKAKIKKLYNKISTLKTKLNSMDIDPDDMKYVELDTTLAFYTGILEDLQQKSMPGIDGIEQNDIKEKIDTVNSRLKELELQIGGSDEEVELVSDTEISEPDEEKTEEPESEELKEEHAEEKEAEKEEESGPEEEKAE